MNVPVGVYDRPPPAGSSYTYTDVTEDWAAPVELIAAYSRIKRRVDEWVEAHT